MTSPDFVLQIELDADPHKAYEAASTQAGIRGWWTRHAEFDGKVGSIAKMRFPDAGFFAHMEVLRLQPDWLVHWRCIDARHPPGVSSDPRDWIGSDVTFEIGPLGDGKCELRFTHIGLVPLECHDVCSNIWEFYIRTSFKQFVELGMGRPAE